MCAYVHTCLHRRRIEQREAFHFWKYLLGLLASHLIVRHRRWRSQRTVVMRLWRTSTVIEASSAIVTHRHGWRATAAAWALWHARSAEAARIQSVLTKRLAPLTRQLLHGAVERWVMLVLAIHEQLALTGRRCAHRAFHALMRKCKAHDQWHAIQARAEATLRQRRRRCGLSDWRHAAAAVAQQQAALSGADGHFKRVAWRLWLRRGSYWSVHHDAWVALRSTGAARYASRMLECGLCRWRLRLAELVERRATRPPFPFSEDQMKFQLVGARLLRILPHGSAQHADAYPTTPFPLSASQPKSGLSSSSAGLSSSGSSHRSATLTVGREHGSRKATRCPAICATALPVRQHWPPPIERDLCCSLASTVMPASHSDGPADNWWCRAPLQLSVPPPDDVVRHACLQLSQQLPPQNSLQETVDVEASDGRADVAVAAAVTSGCRDSVADTNSFGGRSTAVHFTDSDVVVGAGEHMTDLIEIDSRSALSNSCHGTDATQLLTDVVVLAQLRAFSGWLRAAWRHWHRSALALQPILAFEARSRTLRRIETLKYVTSAWRSVKDGRRALHTLSVSLRNSSLLHDTRSAFREWTVASVLATSITRALGRSWLIPLRSALFYWRRAVRVYVTEWLVLQTAVIETVRATLAWWRNVADSRRASTLALAVAAHRSQISRYAMALSQWHTWTATEHFYLTRNILRQTDTLREMIACWQERTARAAAIRAATVSAVTSGSQPSSLNDQLALSGASAIAVEFTRCTPTCHFSRATSYPSTCMSSRPASRSSLRAVSPVSATPTANPPSASTRPQLPIDRNHFIPIEVAPTHAARTSCVVLANKHTVSRRLSTPNQRSIVELGGCRLLLLRWIRSVRWTLRVSLLADKARCRRATEVLASLHTAADAYRSIVYASTAVALSRHTTALRDAIALWVARANAAARGERANQVGAQATSDRKRSSLTIAWTQLLGCSNRHVAAASMHVAAFHFNLTHTMRLALGRWKHWATFDRFARDLEHERTRQVLDALPLMHARSTPRLTECGSDSLDTPLTTPGALPPAGIPRAKPRQALCDLAGDVNGRRALFKWHEGAQHAKHARDVERQLNSRRKVRVVRFGFNGINAHCGKAHGKRLMRLWSTQREPLRRWRKAAVRLGFERAVAGAAAVHVLHLAWHWWRRCASSRMRERVIALAARSAAASHSFVCAWHAWRRRTLELAEYADAEMEAAAHFVLFVQGSLRECLTLVLAHWRQVSGAVGHAQMMSSYARRRRQCEAAQGALHALGRHARQRRRRRFERIERRMLVRTHRLATRWHLWATKAHKAAAAARHRVEELRDADASCWLQMRAALRQWRLATTMVVGLAFHHSLVGASLQLRAVSLAFSWWSTSSAIHSQSATRSAWHLGLRALKRLGLRRLWHFSVQARHVQCAASSVTFIRKRQGLADALGRWHEVQITFTQRALWLGDSTASAIACVRRIRILAAWCKWPRSRTPASTAALIAVAHALRCQRRRGLQQWHAWLVHVQPWRDSLLLKTWYIARGLSRRVGMLHTSFKWWVDAMPRLLLFQSIDEPPRRRLTHTAAVWAANAHVTRTRLRTCWRRWLVSQLTVFQHMVRAIAQAWARSLTRAMQAWRRHTRREHLLLLLPSRAAASQLTNAWCAPCHKRAWVCWQRRVAERHAAVGAAQAAMQSTQRRCWRRWPRYRHIRPDTVAAVHVISYRLRCAWALWPRHGSPPFLLHSMAITHARIALLRRASLLWQLSHQVSSMGIVERLVHSRQLLAYHWPLFVFAISTLHASRSLHPAALAFACHTAMARAVRLWLGKCLGHRQNRSRGGPPPPFDAWVPVPPSEVCEHNYACGTLDDCGTLAAAAMHTEAFCASPDSGSKPGKVFEDPRSVGHAGPVADGSDVWAFSPLGWGGDAATFTAADLGAAAANTEGGLSGRCSDQMTPTPQAQAVLVDASALDLWTVSTLLDEPVTGEDFGAFAGEWNAQQLPRQQQNGPAAAGAGDARVDNMHPICMHASYHDLLASGTLTDLDISSAHQTLASTAACVRSSPSNATPAALQSSLLDLSLYTPTKPVPTHTIPHLRRIAMMRDLDKVRSLRILMRWHRHALRRQHARTLCMSAVAMHTKNVRLAAWAMLWRHSTAVRTEAYATQTSQVAYSARQLRRALRVMLEASRIPWWRLRREQVVAHTLLRLRRQLHAALAHWASHVAPLSRGIRLQTHWHVRRTMAKAIDAWRASWVSLCTLAHGYIQIAGRVGYRIALGSFVWWRKLAAMPRACARVQRFVGLVIHHRLLSGVMRTWASDVRSGRLGKHALHQYRTAVFATPYRLRRLRGGYDKWFRACVDWSLSSALAYASEGASNRAASARAMRLWRVLVAYKQARAQCDALEVFATAHAAHRSLVKHMATSFHRWREICLDLIPPVLKQLMRVRSRMESASAITN